MGIRMRSISSVAYAEEDMTSDDRTARAVGFQPLASRCSLTMGGPSRIRLNR